MKIKSELVKRLRSEKNWSQEKLSEACGLNLRTIQRLENTGKASIESVKALAATFAVEPDELILFEKDEALTPLDAIKTGFIKYGNFSDTATRFEYWWFLLFVLLVAALGTIIHERVYQFVSVILLLPLIAVGNRRLNDIGRSGWWQLLSLVPFGVVVVLYLFSLESDTKANQATPKHLDTA